MKRALNYSFWGKGTSVHPTPLSLTPVLVIDIQSLEYGHRSMREHLKSSTKEFQPLQPVSQLLWGHNSNVSMLRHVAWGINKRN